MGSYGVGIERTMASVVERNHDDGGIIWPLSIAPFEVVVTVIKPKDVATRETATALYEALQGEGIDVVFDDRDERPGVKFKDADLVGIPYRVTVGPKGLADGKVELVRRRGGEPRALDLQKAAGTLTELVLEERGR